MHTLSSDQLAVEKAGLLESGGVIMMPTGGGKTWLSRRAIHKRLEGGLKSVYLSPLKAIARELYSQWKVEFAGHKVGVYTGEVGVDEVEDMPTPAEADIIIATPEKLDLYLRAWSDHIEWLARIGLLVVDEVHTLDSGRRGATLEGLITRLKSVNPYVDVLGLSATLGNPEELAAWLGGRCFKSTKRPIPLQWRIRAYSKNEPKADAVLEEVKETLKEGGQTIVFVQSRQRSEGLAKKLVDEGVKAVAHHAGMSKGARDKAEAAYRGGECGTIVCTPTLAAGVNLPARKVVLHDLQRWGNGGWEDLKCIEVWQMGGRAGRPGLDDKGEVVLLAPVWNQKAARALMRGQFEDIKSQVEQRAAFSEQLMVCFGSRLTLKAVQAERVMSKTLAGRSYTPGEMKLRVEGAIEEMVRAEMLERNEDGYIRATRLGRIATRFQLTAKTVIAWKKLEDLVSEATLFDIMLAICASADFTSRLRVDHDEVMELQAALDQEPMKVREMSAETRRCVLSVSGKDMVSAVKTALALRAWTRLGDVEEAASAMDCMEHELEEARKEAVRMIQAMLAMLNTKPRVVSEGGWVEPNMQERAGALSAMVCAGLDDEQATLALVDGVGPIMARRLAKAGFTDVEALAQAEPEDVSWVDGVSLKRATKWVEQASELVNKGGALRYREVCAKSEVVAQDHRLAKGLDYYRWMRAQALKAEDKDGGWEVSGGSEPHRVELKGASKYRCNCQDAAKGTRLCKHVILVMHEQGEDGIPKFSEGFPTGDGKFDLESEWSRPVMMEKRQWR